MARPTRAALAAAIVLLGVLPARAQTAISAADTGWIIGATALVLIQIAGIVVTLPWTAGATFALLKLVEAFVPLRVGKQAEREGLYLTLHGEAMHT